MQHSEFQSLVSAKPYNYIILAIWAGICVGLWQLYPWPLATAYTLFSLLLAIGTVIDIDKFILPDEITKGGTLLGILTMGVIIPIITQSNILSNFWYSVIGAAAGWAIIRSIIELGKIMYGKKTLQFEKPTEFYWKREGDTAKLTVEGETYEWEDMFNRESDILTFEECNNLNFEVQPETSLDSLSKLSNSTLKFQYTHLLSEKKTDLMQINSISGTCTKIIVPREAMGMGDAKLMACIGAFLGWEGVLFTLFTSSTIGFLIGTAGIMVLKDKTKTMLPYGPYLALGAILWLFGGSNLFFSLFHR